MHKELNAKEMEHSERVTGRERPVAWSPRVMVVSEPGLAGVKRHVCHLLESLVESEFQVAYVYSLSRRDETYENEVRSLQQRGVECFHVPMVREISPWSDARAAGQIWNVIRKWKPDIVHCHSAKAGFLGRFAAKLNWSRPTTVYTPNAMPCYFSKKYKVLERLAGRWTNWLIAVTDSEKNDFIDWQIVPDSRVRVIPMAVVTDEVNPVGAGESCITIGGCGRICRQKRSLFFFQLGAALMEHDDRIRLKWIGDFSDDEEADEVRQFLRETPYADRIEVTGWVSNSNEHIAGLDLFCMFSRYESFGFVTADAMSLHVPVVAIDGTGTRDLIKHGETGLICNGTLEDGVRQVRRLIDEDGLADRLVGQAATHVESHFAPEVSDRSLHSFYNEILGTTTSRRKPR